MIFSHFIQLASIIHIYYIAMGNETNVCKNPCIGDQQIAIKPSEQIATITKAQKLQPILFDEDRDSAEPHSHIQKQKSAQEPNSTPNKKLLSPAGSDLSAMVSKMSATKTSKLNFQGLVVVSPESRPYNQIDDHLIEVPYSVIRLTMSAKLKRAVDELGPQIIDKFEKEQGQTWKLHKKGHYVSCLGEKLYAILTPNFYYEGELQENGKAIVPVGNGILISEQGLYSGAFLNGKAQGSGHFRDIDQKTTYKGTWRDGVLEEGIIEHPGFRFQGNFREGIAFGKGKLHFKDNGFAYVGKFDQGLFHDKNGFLQGKNYIYEGGFQGGRKEGEGCLIEKEQTQKQIKNRKEKRMKYHPAQQFQGLWHKDYFQGRGRATQAKKSHFRT